MKSRSKGKSGSIERELGDCYRWNVKQGSVQGEMLSVFATITVNVKQVPVLLLSLQNRRRATMVNNLRKAGRPGEAVHPFNGARCRAKIPSQEIARIHRVILCTLPCEKNYTSQAGCKFGEKCSFLHGETDREPKKAKKGRGKRVRGLCSDCQLTAPKKTCSIDVRSFAVCNGTG